VFLKDFAGWVTRLHERSAPLAEVVRAAAATADPVAIERWAWGNERQINDCHQPVNLLQRRGWPPAALVVQQPLTQKLCSPDMKATGD
jgi:hypothetical protein